MLTLPPLFGALLRLGEYFGLIQISVGSGIVLVASFLVLFSLTWMTAEHLHREEAARRKFEEELKLSQKKAETANAAKTIFISNLSHEIRTPLSAIIGFSEILKSPVKLPANDKKTFIERINANANHLIHLVDNSLDLSKIEVGQLKAHISDFSVHHELDSTIESLRALALKKGLEFTCTIDSSVPTAIRSDPVRIRQVLFNLVQNSIKFTNKGRSLWS